MLGLMLLVFACSRSESKYELNEFGVIRLKALNEHEYQLTHCKVYPGREEATMITKEEYYENWRSYTEWLDSCTKNSALRDKPVQLRLMNEGVDPKWVKKMESVYLLPTQYLGLVKMPSAFRLTEERVLLHGMVFAVVYPLHMP